MIEGIEHFGAHLEKLSLADLEFFGERCIQVADAVTSQIGEVAGCIARNIVARITKTILIEDAPSRLGRIAIAQAARELRADHVRSLIAVSQQPGSVVERDRVARLQGEQ